MINHPVSAIPRRTGYSAVSGWILVLYIQDVYNRAVLLRVHSTLHTCTFLGPCRVVVVVTGPKYLPASRMVGIMG